MTLQPLTPLDLPAFASILREGREIACDWLYEQFAERHGIDPAGQQALADTLLLYARDEVACPHPVHRYWTGDVSDYANDTANWRQPLHPDCLLAVHFTEPLLARYLGMVGDGRAEEVRLYRVEEYDGASDLRWYVLPSALYGWMPDDGNTFSTEAAARLDLKRRVLGLFGAEHGRIAWKEDGSMDLIHPIDFLPQYGHYATVREVEQYLTRIEGA